MCKQNLRQAVNTIKNKQWWEAKLRKRYLFRNNKAAILLIKAQGHHYVSFYIYAKTKNERTLIGAMIREPFGAFSAITFPHITEEHHELILKALEEDKAEQIK